MKYYILDKDGNYLGLVKDSPEGYEFFTTVPIVGNFVKFKFDGKNWIEGATEQEILESREIPQSVPLWAMKAVLEEKGLLDVIESVFDNLEPTTKKKVLIFWNNGNFIERQSQTVAMLGQILSKTVIEIDGFFVDAEKLQL